MKALLHARSTWLDAYPFRPSHRAFGREMVTLALDFEPNGVFFDTTRARLYVVDETHARIRVLERGSRIPRIFVQCSPGVVSGRLGHVAVDAEGALWVPRYGHGESGGLLRVQADGRQAAIERLDARRRRIGVALGPDGFIYSASFLHCADPAGGAVSRVSPTGGEVDVLVGLQKPVGLAATSSGLIVADQARDRVLRIAPGRPAGWKELTSVPEPGPLASGRDGQLFVGSRQGAVVLVDRRGATRTIAIDLGDPRGLAWDPDGIVWIADRRAPEVGVGAGPWALHAIHVPPN